MKRSLLYFLVTALLFGALAGCAGGPAQTTEKPKPWYKARAKARPMTAATDKSAPVQAAKPSLATTRPKLNIAKPANDCLIIRTGKELDTCRAWAQLGNGYAAYLVGKAYERGVRTHWLSLRRDTSQALRWHSMALEAGEMASLRYLFNANYYGIKIPRNRKAAMEYLNKAAELKQDWALLVLAKWSAKNDPKKSFDYYLTLAQKGNCHAMEKVAELCMTSYARPANYTLAYFWGMAVDKMSYRKHSEYHQLWGRTSTGSNLCGGSKVKPRAQSKLNKKYRMLAEQEAAAWKPGEKEPYLPSPPPHLVMDNPEATKAREVKLGKNAYAKAVAQTYWKPIQLSLAGHFSQELEPSALFDMVRKSVWVVMAANSKRDLDRKRNLSIGSGVAVSDNVIITNYHVVKGRLLIKVRQGGRTLDAQVLSHDKKTDRCVLLISGQPLIAVRGYRPYRSLKVGEKVYTVGSPKGLENTLGQGLISGLRRNNQGMRMVQTNAQISKGSSGGGLFDRFGNLIGITTLTVKDSQALNFAISVEDYTSQ